jgi:hypothetical protein
MNAVEIRPMEEEEFEDTKGVIRIQSSKRVRITGPSIKFTGHSHTPQRRYLDSYWSFGPVMNNLLLDQTNFYWTLPHVRWKHFDN